jgi:hypothetical protein
MKKDIDKFPSIDNVHEVLSDLTGLFNDRTKLLDTMFREDKYKEFLLAENMQQLAEADKRDDSANGRIKKDLANGYEVLKAKTTMKKFANFLSPSAIPPMDLTSSDDFSDDDDVEEEEAPEEKEKTKEAEKGEKGDDGADGEDGADAQPQPENKVSLSSDRQQTPNLKLAQGGVVPPSPMMNSLTPSMGQRPETKSGVKSLESLGLVGKKNVATELTEDLGLEKYKKALADAMALPLKAVAAGLAGLMDKIDVPGGEGAALEGQISKVGKTFGVKTKKKKKENKLMNFVKGGGIVGALGRMLGGGKKKKSKGKSYKTDEELNAAIEKSDVQDKALMEYLDTGEWPEWGGEKPKGVGGPSLGMGGAAHPPEAPDAISTQGSTRLDKVRNTFNTIKQGAKKAFMSSSTGMAISATTSVLNKIIGGVQPAEKGSQYEKQDINSLTNQVIMDNEMNMSELNQLTIKGATGESDMSTESIMKAIASMGSNSGMGIGESDPLPPAPLKPSKHLLHSISIVDGGQTPNDVV